MPGAFYHKPLRQQSFCYRVAGFTLIEMLIAMAIGAGIAVIAYRALDGAIAAEAKVNRVATQIDEVDRVWQYLGADLLYAVPRTWQTQDGTVRSALVGVGDERLSQSDTLVAGEEDYLVQFIRSNRENLLQQNRSDLYIAGYRLTQDDDSDLKTLWRDAWSPVDGSGEPKLFQRQLLTGIQRLRLRYLPLNFDRIAEEAWVPSWPATRGVRVDLPAAVEVEVELASLGKIVRIFPLTVAAP